MNTKLIIILIKDCAFNIVEDMEIASEFGEAKMDNACVNVIQKILFNLIFLGLFCSLMYFHRFRNDSCDTLISLGGFYVMSLRNAIFLTQTRIYSPEYLRAQCASIVLEINFLGRGTNSGSND